MTDALTPRLKTRYQTEIKDALQKEFTYENVMQIPGSRRLSSTWVLAPLPMMPSDQRCCGRPHRHHRPEAGDPSCPKSIANFKLREGHAYRRSRHPAWRPHVGISRPSC